jgi:hypothetical protein
MVKPHLEPRKLHFGHFASSTFSSQATAKDFFVRDAAALSAAWSPLPGK